MGNLRTWRTRYFGIPVAVGVLLATSLIRSDVPVRASTLDVPLPTQVLMREDRLISIYPYRPSGSKPNRDVLARVFEGNKLAYRDILAYYGPPSDIYMGTGTQGGGFGVNGYADSGGSAPAGPTGAGQPSTSQAAQPGQSAQAAPSVIGKIGAPLEGVDPAGAGLVTWVYDNFARISGNTLSITFDEFYDGAVVIIRYYGTNFRAPVGTPTGGIRLGASFSQVLARYGYPDMTVTQSYNETAEYDFGANVVFGFQGSGPNMRVDSITINAGGEPEPLPPGEQGTHTREILEPGQ